MSRESNQAALKALIVKHGLSRQDVRKRLSVSIHAVNNWLLPLSSGGNRTFSNKNLKKLEDSLK
jgi:transposase